jgi:hypothetical protein
VEERSLDRWTKTWNTFQTNQTFMVSFNPYRSPFLAGILNESELTLSGDETTQQELENRANSFQVAEWWKHKIPSITEIADANIKNGRNSKAPSLHNPYEGNSCARQLDETVDEFLKRLPPSSTRAKKLEVPWIFIANPYRKAPRVIRKEDGGEDLAGEGPPAEDSQWAEFLRVAGRLLDELLGVRNIIERKRDGQPKATITRAINIEKDRIVMSILKSAADLQCTSGKAGHDFFLKAPL